MFDCKVVVTEVEWETLDLATPPTPPGLMTSKVNINSLRTLSPQSDNLFFFLHKMCRKNSLVNKLALNLISFLLVKMQGINAPYQFLKTIYLTCMELKHQTYSLPNPNRSI